MDEAIVPGPRRAASDAPIAFVSPDTEIDLTNCEREPIHIPGAIQPYGVLLVLREPTFEIVQASESTASHLGVEARDVVGRPLADLLGEAAVAQVRTMIIAQQMRGFGELSVGASGRRFDATAHRSDGLTILELEPVVESDQLSPLQVMEALRATIERLERAESMTELAGDIATEMRSVTGFDRVWVYKFHPDWHGEIIGESRREGIETWMGMHYPASDIPAQARALFLRNWVRMIPSVSFVPSPLLPADNPLTGAPLDLGGSLLRSVSPIHVEYLGNMGVTASLVISLIHRGQLWGLISGHHYGGPKRVSYGTRSLCEFLAQALSLQIGLADRLEDREYALQVRIRQSDLIAHLIVDEDVERAVTAGPVTLLELTNASGAAIVRAGRITRLGITPDVAEIAALAAWLEDTIGDVYASDRLAADFPAAAAYPTVASGLLAVPLSHGTGDLVLWFRPEQRQSVRWAGDPRKPVTLAPDGSPRLHPRGSFELWEEESRGSSTPWHPVDIQAALDTRRALLDRLIRSAEETARLNAELQTSNMQLQASAIETEVQAQQLREQRLVRERLLQSEREARAEAERANKAKADFLAVMSHELRTPLNAIGGYSQLMALGIRGDVTTEQQQDLERIQVNQRHLLGLINSILNFTKLEAAQIEFTLVDVPVNRVLLGIDALVAPQMLAKLLQFSVVACDRTVTVHADEEKLRQILLNLLTNAIKFTSHGGRVSLSCEQQGSTVSISVIDTGRGIRDGDLAAVFEPFVQIERHITPAHDQGVGLGLAISRELARGMDGDLTVVSEVSVGSTFTLTLPAVTASG